MASLNVISLYIGTDCDRDVRVLDHGIVSLVRTTQPAGLNLYFKCMLGATKFTGTLYFQKGAWNVGERYAQIFYGDMYNDFKQRATGGRVVIFSEDATHWHIGIWRGSNYYDLAAAQSGGVAAMSMEWHGRNLVMVDGTMNVYRAGVVGDVFTALPALVGALDVNAYSIAKVGRTFWVSEDGEKEIYVYAGNDLFSGDPIETITAPSSFRSMMFDGRCLWILATSGILFQCTIK